MALPQGPFYESLGKKIRQARGERKIRQKEIARAIGLSRTSITNIEKGRQPVQVHVLVKIAETLNVDLNGLLMWEKPKAKRAMKIDFKKVAPPIRKWVEEIIGEGHALRR